MYTGSRSPDEDPNASTIVLCIARKRALTDPQCIRVVLHFSPTSFYASILTLLISRPVYSWQSRYGAEIN